MTTGYLSAALPVAAPSFYPSSEHSGDADHHHDVPKTYHFQYSVHDPLTGDIKNQNEVSDGHGTVKGTYSLVEPDGSTRVVEYTADDIHGFMAEVKKIAPQHKTDSHAYNFELTDHKESSHIPAPVHDNEEHYNPEIFSTH